MKNNCLKMLADSLSKYGIASFRYDKRGIAKSSMEGYPEDSLRFEAMVEDAKAWVNYLHEKKKFKTITILGHSEGSLVGMLMAAKADKYISLAGISVSADSILKEQLSSQPEPVKNICFPKLDSLKKGFLLSDVAPMLYSLFRPSVLPYLISWFKHNPSVEIARLKIPTMIIQGDRDIQVAGYHAENLHKANSTSILRRIPQMNHILKIVPESDRAKNLSTYDKPDIPISSELVNAVVKFVLK